LGALDAHHILRAQRSDVGCYRQQAWRGAQCRGKHRRDCGRDSLGLMPMSTRDDIGHVYARDCAPPVQLPAWATLPLRTTADGGLKADGWSVTVFAESYQGPERRAVPREPVLLARGERVLPRRAGWLFGARAK
jgi:hypothetical protein